MKSTSSPAFPSIDSATQCDRESASNSEGKDESKLEPGIDYTLDDLRWAKWKYGVSADQVIWWPARVIPHAHAITDRQLDSYDPGGVEVAVEWVAMSNISEKTLLPPDMMRVSWWMGHRRKTNPNIVWVMPSYGMSVPWLMSMGNY